jgi:hypothetical protein
MANTMKTFDALDVSSKFAICGLPIRVDTYKTCSFGLILSILVYTFFSRMFDLMQPPVVKHNIAVA